MVLAAHKPLASWDCFPGFILSPVVPLDRCAQVFPGLRNQPVQQYSSSWVLRSCACLLLLLLFCSTVGIVHFLVNLAGVHRTHLLTVEWKHGSKILHVLKTEVCVNDMLCCNKTCPGLEVLSVTMSHAEDEAIDVKVKENVSWAPFSLRPNQQKNRRQDMFSDLSASVASTVKSTGPQPR